MGDKVDILVRLELIDQGRDYFDRYFRLTDNIYVYIFESHDKQRYVWQCKQPCDIDLVIGCTYHMQASIGRRLFGGRGLSIYEVEFLGEMTIKN